MKTALLLLLCLPWFAGAQDRYVTLTLRPPDPTGVSWTNTLNIAEGEVAQFVSEPADRMEAPGLDGVRNFSLAILKDGLKFITSVTRLPVVAGPAQIQMVGFSGILTFKVTPSVFGPDKTLIVPPGPGGAVALESSTNLIHWVTATNGLYQDPVTARFFRIRFQSPK